MYRLSALLRGRDEDELHPGEVYVVILSRIYSQPIWKHIDKASSADLTKKAQILLYENEELKQLGFRMLIPVHDEIIAECPVENVKRCSELMSQLMKEAGSELCVPLSCDVALFYSWYGEEKDISEFVA